MFPRLLAPVTVLALFAGCAVPFDAAPVACESPLFGVVTGPVNDQGGITRETKRSIPALVRLTNRADVELTPILPDRPTRENAPNRLDLFNVTTFHGNRTLAPNATLFALVEYTGGFRGEYPPFEIRATLQHDRDECLNTPTVSSVYTFVGDYVGEVARPGVGALVRTAGFWTNGTLFYTNMDDVQNNTNFGRAGWYTYDGGDPLPVYIYNNTRDERPQRYNESGFLTTIPGFNEALKGLSSSGATVAHLMPEEAYTRTGNEAHALYGDELVFYIEITDVVAVDCPLPQPVCEEPTLPPAFHAAMGGSSGARRVAPTAT